MGSEMCIRDRYRRMEENARILEYKCVEFGEDAMYGHLRRGVQKDPAVDY